MLLRYLPGGLRDMLRFRIGQLLRARKVISQSKLVLVEEKKYFAYPICHFDFVVGECEEG